jgi:UDP:flavonoid glycosyltransferase YjiC (YdhE family)
VQHEIEKANSTSKFSPKPSLRSTPSGQVPARYTSRVDGSLPTQSIAISARQGFQETIGLFESMSHQTDGEDIDYIPKASSSPVILHATMPNDSSCQQKQQGQIATKAWDVTPTPRLLLPLEGSLSPSYSRSPDMDTSSRASDDKPLLYTKVSTLKASRYRRGLVSV